MPRGYWLYGVTAPRSGPRSGRNRRAACKIAGVKPPTRMLNGEDPTKFVISANIHRRMMNKGQQAIAVAMVYPETEVGGKGKKAAGTKAAESAGFSRKRLEDARVILKHAPDLAHQVLQGSEKFDVAYKAANLLKVDAATHDAQLADLRERHPDLADKVADEELTLDEALC